MTRTRVLTLLSVLLLAGCPTRPDDGVEIVGPPQPVPTADSGTDTGATKGAVATLRIASPASNVSTNGTVAITVDVDSGTAPATIQLVVDGTALTTLSAPAPYHYTWDTTGVADGPHTLLAQATVDGQAIASPPVTVIVDRTAPTIASTVPATGAVNVVLRAPMTVTFSEPIAASSFTSSSVALQAAGAGVATTATLAADGLSATIVINDVSSFTLPATFSATLAPTITDLVGNPIKAPGAWSWNVPDWIKYASVASSTQPALAVGPNFQPTLAYTRCLTAAGASSCTDDLFVAASDGQAWNSLGQVPALVGPGSLDLNAQGQPIVAGVGVTAGLSDVSLRMASWDGSDWDGSIAPFTIATTSAVVANPLVRLDPSGHPVVAWRDGIASVDADIGVARWTGTAWDQSFGKFGLTNADSASLILDGSGNPIVGFSQGGGGIFSLATSTFRAWNGTSWTSATSNPVLSPFVALDTALEPMMLASSTVEHYASGTWLPAVATAIPYSAAAGSPRLTTGPDHQPVVAWLDTTAPLHVGLARWTGTAWNAHAGLFNAGGVVASEAPGVLVDGRGSVWVFWREGGAANVWMSNY
jgi:Bacterial Ig-like domain/Bacterial Ig domain